MSAENTRDYYRNQGAEAERERIIKLLESNGLSLAHLDKLDQADAFRKAIALIKGETK